MKQIKATISPSGDMKITAVHGYGANCLEATKFLESALGKVDESTRTTTDEMLQPSVDMTATTNL